MKVFISIHPDTQSPITVAPLRLLLVPHLVSRLFLLLIHLSCLRFLPLFLRCLFLGQIAFHSCGRRRLIQNLSRSLPLWWRLLCNKESELCPLVYSTHSVSSFWKSEAPLCINSLTKSISPSLETRVVLCSMGLSLSVIRLWCLDDEPPRLLSAPTRVEKTFLERIEPHSHGAIQSAERVAAAQSGPDLHANPGGYSWCTKKIHSCLFLAH